MNPQEADVFITEKKAGVLRKTRTGHQFEYDKAYLSDPEAMPISLSLPLKSQPFESKELFPFFDNLLPEGWLLKLTSSTLKIDPHQKFELLLQIGQDPVGAVTIIPRDVAS